MDITFYLVLVCLFLINKSNDNYGKIYEKKQYLNYIFLIAIVSISGYSINSLIFVIMNHNDLMQFFKNYVYMPQWLSLLMWISHEIFSFLSILLIYYMIQRKELARLWFVRIIPIVAITFLYDVIRELYETISTTTAPLYIVIGMWFIIILPFAIVYYFYSRDDVKNSLFIQNLEEEKV